LDRIEHPGVVVRKNSVDQEICLCNNVTQTQRILLILKAD
jgi:hypothetical protein